MNTLVKIAAAIALLAMIFFAGMMTHHRWYEKNVQKASDTVYVWNTIEAVDIPAAVMVSPAPDSIAPVQVKKEELIPNEDSSSFTIAPDIHIWRDTLPSGISYEVAASGIGTELHSLSFRWPEQQVTHTETRTVEAHGWALFAVGGASVSGFTPSDLSPSLSLELEYSHGPFSFGISPGIQWERPPGTTSHKASFMITGSMKVRLCRF